MRNFRCFGDEETRIPVESGITAFVGDNGAGKSSALEALKRLFSPITSEQSLRKADVHFGPKEDGETVEKREIIIDVVFGFSGSSGPERANAVPKVFNDMFFDAADGELKVRLRFEGIFKRTESLEDDIEKKIYIVKTLDTVPFGPDDDRKSPMRGNAKQYAELVYIPAHRDSLNVTRHALRGVLKRLERSADWDDETRNKSSKAAKELEDRLNEVPAVERVASALKEFWRSLHIAHYDAEPRLSVVAREFEQLIRDLTLRFEKSPGGGQRQLEELSEGQVSLLYFALSATLHTLIWDMESANPNTLEGFKALDILPAPMVIFALEEPENHLSPYYLPRLINLLKELINEGPAQALVTSHSASILRRIPPKHVRHFRLCPVALTSFVTEIPLPGDDAEAARFLEQVILANPEIYFAKLVLIGEGDSEKIVIPRLAEAFGLPLDPSFVAFVPIGGRHAQHLWKLTTGLQIPCLTLLDLDLGRYGGGMGRIKNAVTWLKDIGSKLDPADVPTNDKLTQESWETWNASLRDVNVFYSSPLDIDMMMLQAFPDAYTAGKVYDPKKDNPDDLAKKVFGNEGAGHIDLARIGSEVSGDELYAYRRLFKSRSKPASHYVALSNLDDKALVANCPEPLKALIERAKVILTLPSDKEEEQ